jgi:hypothetical protein
MLIVAALDLQHDDAQRGLDGVESICQYFFNSQPRVPAGRNGESYRRVGLAPTGPSARFCEKFMNDVYIHHRNFSVLLDSVLAYQQEQSYPLAVLAFDAEAMNADVFDRLKELSKRPETCVVVVVDTSQNFVPGSLLGDSTWRMFYPRNMDMMRTCFPCATLDTATSRTTRQVLKLLDECPQQSSTFMLKPLSGNYLDKDSNAAKGGSLFSALHIKYNPSRTDSFTGEQLVAHGPSLAEFCLTLEEDSMRLESQTLKKQN